MYFIAGQLDPLYDIWVISPEYCCTVKRHPVTTLTANAVPTYFLTVGLPPSVRFLMIRQFELSHVRIKNMILQIGA